MAAHLVGSSKLLRSMNSTAALALLLERGRLTRGDLREATGLSKPTVSEAMRRLVEAGIAEVVGHVSGGPGPNAEVYAVNPEAGYAGTVCLGPLGSSGPGTAPAVVSAALCDITGAVRAESVSTVELRGVDPVTVIGNALDGVVARAGVARSSVGHVQLGLAGAYDRASKTVHHIDLPGFDRPDLIDALSDRLGTGVDVDNDVNLAAIAERNHGRGADVDAFALIWLGEGLGLAIDLGGTLLRGARGGAGEIGYLPLPGTDGVETANLQDLLGENAVADLAARYGHTDANASDAIAAGVGDPGFARALAQRVAVAVGVVVSVLDPALVVLAGPVARAGGEVLRAAVRTAMGDTALPDTPIALTGLDGDPVTRGGLDAATAAVRARLVQTLAH